MADAVDYHRRVGSALGSVDAHHIGRTDVGFLALLRLQASAHDLQRTRLNAVFIGLVAVVNWGFFMIAESWAHRVVFAVLATWALFRQRRCNREHDHEVDKFFALSESVRDMFTRAVNAAFERQQRPRSEHSQ
jgi:hypothetical protein